MSCQQWSRTASGTFSSRRSFGTKAIGHQSVSDIANRIWLQKNINVTAASLVSSWNQLFKSVSSPFTVCFSWQSLFNCFRSNHTVNNGSPGVIWSVSSSCFPSLFASFISTQSISLIPLFNELVAVLSNEGVKTADDEPEEGSRQRNSKNKKRKKNKSKHQTAGHGL